jgi:hypothetical protein
MHNSWQYFGPKESMILHKETTGNIFASGLLHMQEFVVHPFMALVFNVSYRRKFFFADLHSLHQDD